MSIMGRPPETLQHYKDYADSIEVLNQALSHELKECSVLINSLKSQVSRLEAQQTSAMSPNQQQQISGQL